MRCYGVTDDGVAKLKVFTKLRRLFLRGLYIAGHGLKELTECKNLEELDLAETQADDETALALLNFPNLKILDLWHTQVTDTGLESVGKLTNLEELILVGTPISDAGLSHLTGLSKLKILSIKECNKVTDAANPVLSKLQSLQKLSLDQSGYSENGVAELRKSLPECEISF
jgi:Leucine-rich repeat (LRR) protein